MTNFAEILSRRPEDQERPKPFPAGTYTALVLRHETGETSKKQTPYVRFYFQAVEAHDDVDQEALAEIDMQKKTLRDDFYLTDDALYRLSEFLETLGIEMSGRTFAECLPETINQAITITVSHSINQQDPSIIYSNITGYAEAA
jgi:hypothetical protein